MKRKLLFWLLFCGSLLLFGFQTIEAFGIVAFHAEFLRRSQPLSSMLAMAGKTEVQWALTDWWKKM